MTVQKLLDSGMFHIVNVGENPEREITVPFKHCYGEGAGGLCLGDSDGEYEHIGSSYADGCGMYHYGGRGNVG